MESVGSSPQAELGPLDRAVVWFQCLPMWMRGALLAVATVLVVLTIATLTGVGSNEPPPQVPAGTPAASTDSGGQIVLPPGEQLAR